MTFITTTESRDYNPLLRLANYPWEILQARLVRELGAEFGLLLAEPIIEPGHRHVAWYADTSEPIALAADLAPASCEAVLDRLRSMRQQVHNLALRIENPNQSGGDKNFADALRRAVIVPEDSRFVWAADGKPILVAWGSVYLRDERSVEKILWEYRKTEQRTTAINTPPPQPPLLLPSPPRTQYFMSLPRRSVVPLLWLWFAGLMGAIYYLLLQACGILVAPESSWLSRYLPASCYSVAIADPLGAERARRAELERKIRDAELNVVRSAGDCPPSEQQTQLQLSQTPPNAEAARRPEQVPPQIKTEKTPSSPQAKPDELQISLAWKGLEDLDLYVRCPGGTLSLGSLKNEECGGKLDTDMNNRGANANAVENATWATAPKGKYEVMVKLFSRKNQADRAVPFVVSVKRGNDTQTFDGSASEIGVMISVHAFDL